MNKLEEQEQLNKEKKKKKGSLLVQIGTVFAIIFLVASLGFIFLQVIGNSMTYFEAKREYLTPYLKSTQAEEEKYITNIEWFVEYWRQHPQQIRAETMSPSVQNDEYISYATLTNSETVTPEELDAMPEQKKNIVAAIAYQTFCRYIGLGQWQTRTEQLFVIDVNPDTIGFIYEIGRDWTDFEGYFLGDYMWEDPDEIPSIIKDYSAGKSTEIRYERQDYGKEQAYYYIGYYPVVKNGKILYVICIVHDWSEYHSALIQTLIILGVISVAILIIAGFVLLMFVNRIAVKPLRRVQFAVRKYRKDKDSEDVIEKMNRINERNELGELSMDLSDLVVELNRYNAENSQLIG